MLATLQSYVPNFGGLGVLLQHWQWVAIGVIAAAGLAYAAFVLRNWKIVAAAGVGVALFFAYQWAYAAGYRAKSAEIEVEIRRIEAANRRTIQEILATDAERARHDAARIRELEKQVNVTPPNPRPGLPRDAAGRVRDIR